MSIPRNSARAVNYFAAAFGSFNPECDEDASIKFILHCFLVAGEFRGLSSLAQDGSQIGALEGDPGWRLERRDEAREEHVAYNNWPAGGRFRAYVDPGSYELGYPQFFMDRPLFVSYVRSAIAAYEQRNPTAIKIDTHLAELKRAIK